MGPSRGRTCTSVHFLTPPFLLAPPSAAGHHRRVREADPATLRSCQLGMALPMLCILLVATRGFMLRSSWPAQRAAVPRASRFALPAMGFFDVFKDPVEYERIQAQRALGRAEASDVATVVEIKAARARLAEAAAASGEESQVSLGYRAGIGPWLESCGRSR